MSDRPERPKRVGLNFGTDVMTEYIRNDLYIAQENYLTAEIAALEQKVEEYRAALDEEYRLRNQFQAKCERLERIRDFVASDGLAVSFQSMGQYRTEILRQFRAALEGREP